MARGISRPPLALIGGVVEGEGDRRRGHIITGWFRAGSHAGEMSVEITLALPAFEEEHPMRLNRVGTEGVLEASRLGPGRSHQVMATGDELLTLVRFDLERSTDDDHVASSIPTGL